MPDTTFLNDLAVGPGGILYATDTAITLAGTQAQPQGTAKLYRFESDQKVPTIARKRRRAERPQRHS